jgi:hypothetical protein
MFKKILGDNKGSEWTDKTATGYGEENIEA